MSDILTIALGATLGFILAMILVFVVVHWMFYEMWKQS